jgi:hypothetical protein
LPIKGCRFGAWIHGERTLLPFLRRKEPISPTSPSLLVVASRAGNAGKTTATTLLQTSIDLSGTKARIVEFDDQRRHGRRLPADLVTPVSLPLARDLQTNPEADVRAMSDAFDRTLESFAQGETVIWDTGANLDERLAEFLGGVRIIDEVPADRPAVVLVMARCDLEMIRLAGETAAAFGRAVPEATVAIGLNDALSAWSTLDADTRLARAAAETLGPIIKRGGSMLVPAIPVNLATALRDSEIPWHILAGMEPRDAAKHWGVPHAVAKVRQAELSVTLETARREVVRQLGFPKNET